MSMLKKNIYIHKVIFCKMYHSNKLLLVKTNIYVGLFFTLHIIFFKTFFSDGNKKIHSMVSHQLNQRGIVSS